MAEYNFWDDRTLGCDDNDWCPILNDYCYCKDCESCETSQAYAAYLDQKATSDAKGGSNGNHRS